MATSVDNKSGTASMQRAVKTVHNGLCFRFAKNNKHGTPASKSALSVPSLEGEWDSVRIDLLKCCLDAGHFDLCRELLFYDVISAHELLFHASQFRYDGALRWIVENIPDSSIPGIERASRCRGWVRKRARDGALTVVYSKCFVTTDTETHPVHVMVDWAEEEEEEEGKEQPEPLDVSIVAMHQRMKEQRTLKSVEDTRAWVRLLLLYHIYYANRDQVRCLVTMLPRLFRNQRLPLRRLRLSTSEQLDVIVYIRKAFGHHLDFADARCFATHVGEYVAENTTHASRNCRALYSAFCSHVYSGALSDEHTAGFSEQKQPLNALTVKYEHLIDPFMDLCAALLKSGKSHTELKSTRHREEIFIFTYTLTSMALQVSNRDEAHGEEVIKHVASNLLRLCGYDAVAQRIILDLCIAMPSSLTFHAAIEMFKSGSIHEELVSHYSGVLRAHARYYTHCTNSRLREAGLLRRRSSAKRAAMKRKREREQMLQNRPKSTPSTSPSSSSPGSSTSHSPTPDQDKSTQSDV